MEILTGVLGLLQIANLVFSLKEKISSSKEDKQTISELLLHISSLVDSVADDLKQGIYPHGKCSEMEVYAQHLKSILAGKLDQEQAELLNRSMMESLQVEKLLGQLNNLDAQEKDHNIGLLKMAAGSFRASAQLAKF